MGWFFFFSSWLLFGWFAYITADTYVPPRSEPLEEKFVITTFENGYCVDTEKLTTRIVRTVESVKID